MYNPTMRAIESKIDPLSSSPKVVGRPVDGITFEGDTLTPKVIVASCVYCVNPGEYKPSQQQPTWYEHQKHSLLSL